MKTTLEDIRNAWRQLLKSPGFTITAVLTLALGIGANAAIFTLVHAVLLKNLPVADPKSLIWVGDDSNDCCVNRGANRNEDYSLFSYDTYQSFQKNVPEFEELAAVQAGVGSISVRSEGKDAGVRSAQGEFVSGNYFHTFGLSAAAGRLLVASDDVDGVPAVAVMSYAAWQRDYAGDPAVVGSTLWVNTHPVTIAGIAPTGFYGDRLTSAPPDFFLPIHAIQELADAPYVHDADARWLYVIGRVKPGMAIAPVQEKLSGLMRNFFIASNPLFSTDLGKQELRKVHIVLTPGGAGIQDMQKQYESSLYLLMWISGLVLLIACANIANLLLVRGMGRKAEMSLRTALGAARGRIIRQLLTESVVLAGIGGVVGLGVSYFGTRMLLLLAFPGSENLPIHATPSAAVLGFACGLSLVTGIVFGVAPAWITSHSEPADALRGSHRSTAANSSLLQRSLVILQAALSLVLLVGAGLLSQSLNKLEHQDFKLATANRYIVHIDPQAAGYLPTQTGALYQEMEQRFHALPGVQHVGISTYTPLEGDNWSNAVLIQGQPEPAPNTDTQASSVKANAEYFEAIGTHVVMGRGINAQDTPSAPGVVVVNQAFVKKFLKGANPLGQHMGSTGPTGTGDFEIVGVVEDSNYQDPRQTVNAMYFIPMTQRAKSSPRPIEKDSSLYAGAIVLETQRPMDGIEALTRKTLAGINPNLTLVKFQTFDEQIHGQFNQSRMIARLTLLFGALALVLAAVGLYGVTAYSVARRTSEIGIRMALGEDRLSVVKMVLRGALVQTGIGLAIGVPAALLCVQFIQTQLYGVTATDPGVFAVAVAALLAAAGIAALVPARRAASIEPMQALRTE